MALLIALSTALAAAETKVPAGAQALGYTRCLFDEKPTAEQIAPEGKGDYAWFSGQWYAKPPALDLYSTVDGALTLKLGGDLCSAPRDFAKSKLPLLAGADGFYVEFDVKLSSDYPDHWPAVWLMPAEHNGKQEDHYEPDPPGFERFMEFDIDEGGFGPGLTGTVHSSEGIWKDGYKHVQNPNNVSKTPLDRSQKHTFGGSYDPKAGKVTWWVDGVEQMSATAPYVPAIAAKQHFYMILSCQTHGKNVPYTMTVSGVRAYAPSAK